MKVRIVSGSDVQRLLTPARCYEAVADAMRLTSQGAALQPIRTKMDVPGTGGFLGMMPGAISEPACFGIKVVSAFPANSRQGLPAHRGLVMLFEPAHGALVAIIDGREVTAIRTAAASAVATDVLARADARVLGIYGYGEQALTHVEALRHVRPFDRVLVWGRRHAQATNFAQNIEARFDVGAKAVREPDEVARHSDVICTATSAADPFFLGEWLRPGMHLNIVGSSIPATAEIDIETVARCRVYADFRQSALTLGGDIGRAIAAGAISPEHVLGEIGDVLMGRLAGRQGPDDITLFKSLGMVSEDLTAAYQVYAAAEREQVGTVVEL